MLRRTAGILVVIALVVLNSSCRRLSEPVANGLPREELPASATIQADWGVLVAVSHSTGHPDLLQLWFQDAAGNIRMVVYNLERNRLLHVTMMRKS
jgi:hypothetical protein